MVGRSTFPLKAVVAEHDRRVPGHVAMLLVAARILAASRAKFRGAVKLIFQPAEEFGGGAKQMVEDGVLQGVDEVGARRTSTSINTRSRWLH